MIALRALFMSSFLVPLRNGPIYSYMGAWVKLYRMAKKAI